ncbi:sigma-70 family RNA polymerase sigma factor [Aquihabitans sp. McL0605]|uniref:sigma-70 family RNA polymerase sigma factor n=1 Tax=Aquihabitans sp. McL0605 TaxID=3415671 RepID=UPI003CFA8480
MSDQRSGFGPTSVDDDGSLDEEATDFTALRPRLLGIAQRIVGDRAEAEDVVQDVWLRWQGCDRTRVLNVTAYLVTTTTRTAINASQTARVRRESPMAPSLSDCLLADLTPGPEVGFERAEDLDRGLRRIATRLAPLERAAFVLREGFGYPYPRIAEMLDLTPANARKIVSRAGMRLPGAHRHGIDEVDQRRLLTAFATAAATGEMAGLERMLLGAVSDRPLLAQAC